MTASTNGTAARRASVGPGFATLCDSAVQLANSLPAPLQRLSLRVGDWAIDVEFAPQPHATPTPGPAPNGLVAVPTLPSSDAAAEQTGTVVRSELVGTFFAAPSPGAEPFVRIGDHVDEGQQLGIVEAMKLMNPVLAPCSGSVSQIHVSDAESVEYSQALLTVEPTGPPT
jgi:acetyl-CoA carboxylase biotin carboxyl carrier protein